MADNSKSKPIIPILAISVVLIFGALLPQVTFATIEGTPQAEQTSSSEQQEEATTATEMPGSTEATIEGNVTINEEPTTTGQQESNIDTTANETTTTMPERPSIPAGEQEQVPTTTTVPPEQQGNAFFGFEQLVDFQQFTEDCLKQLVNQIPEIWFNGILIGIQTPEGQAGVDAVENASDVISDQVEQQLPPEVIDNINDQAQDVVEAIQNASDSGLIDISDDAISAINDSANAGSIIDEETQEGVIEEVGDATGATDDLSDVIAGGVDDVISGDSNASEAAEDITNEIEVIANDTASEITPGDVTDAVGDMNVTEIADEITDIAQGNDTLDLADDIIDNAIDNANETPSEAGTQTILTELTNVRDSLSAIIARIG